MKLDDEVSTMMLAADLITARRDRNRAAENVVRQLQSLLRDSPDGPWGSWALNLVKDLGEVAQEDGKLKVLEFVLRIQKEGN